MKKKEKSKSVQDASKVKKTIEKKASSQKEPAKVSSAKKIEKKNTVKALTLNKKTSAPNKVTNKPTIKSSSNSTNKSTNKATVTNKKIEISKKSNTVNKKVEAPKPKQVQKKVETSKKAAPVSKKVEAPKSKLAQKKVETSKKLAPINKKFETQKKAAPVSKKVEAPKSKLVQKKVETSKKLAPINKKSEDKKTKNILPAKKKEEVPIKTQTIKASSKNVVIEEAATKQKNKKKDQDEKPVTSISSKLSLKKKPVKELATKNKKKAEASDLEEEAAGFEDLSDDLSLDLDDFANDILESTPVKRRPGRPPKQRDSSGQTIALPPSIIRLPKKEPSKPRKPLSDTLPGTSLAALLVSNNTVSDLFGNSSKPAKKEGEHKAKESHHSKDKHPYSVENDELSSITDEEDSQSTPSWVPRNWVTREGERLIIRGNELLKEEQFGNLHTEATYGVISPDQVDDVIRKIRESYKKKIVPKKSAAS